jgi:hypothetical protein
LIVNNLITFEEEFIMSKIVCILAILMISFVIIVPPSTYADEIILQGQIIIWPPMPERPRTPELNTTRVKFDLARGIEGPELTYPDQHGVWEEHFWRVDQNNYKMKIQASWNSESQAYICRKPCIVNVPMSSNRIIKTNLWHPQRIMQEVSSEANDIVLELQEKYPCFSESRIGNYTIWRCWENKDHSLYLQALELARKGIDKFKKAEGYHKTNRIIVNRATLEIGVCLFCEAAQTYSRVDKTEKPLTIKNFLVDKVKLLQSDAYLQCARIKTGEEKKSVIKTAIKQLEDLSLDEEFKQKRKTYYARALGNWLDLMRYSSSNPNNDLIVAREIRESMNESWQRFRNEADKFYNMKFSEPETTHYIVADRIQRISEKLKR